MPPTLDGSTTANDVSPVKSAERTVKILETLAASPTRLTLSELQERMGYPRSSLHALVRTLRELKWVEADETGAAFGVGPHALLSGTAYLDRDPALRFAQETIEDLRGEVGYTIHYARRDEAHVLYLASRESRDSVRVVSRVGRRLPVHVTALGQALLADLTEAEVDDLLPGELTPVTAQTITERARLHAELDVVRKRGWAFELEQGTEGVACVAVAVGYRLPTRSPVRCRPTWPRANTWRRWPTRSPGTPRRSPARCGARGSASPSAWPAASRTTSRRRG
jgi:DNA-binding IclR family transcriptional regulator